jgi:site-specific DNA-methyltransferase (adenine-specific)
MMNSTLLGGCQNILPDIPGSSIDLIFTDPPYNKDKSFGSEDFSELDNGEYRDWFSSWFEHLVRIIKDTGSIYICADWSTSPIIYPVLEDHCHVKNRITWERNKGRGAKSNWKNVSEDIWFLTMSSNYTFNIEEVKIRKDDALPYRDEDGNKKDWEEDEQGRYRKTHPSNVWSDITAPFWSMPENTDHPTQKPEKMLERIILASSNKGDIVLDPFLGSGTTSVVAKRLERQWIGIEKDGFYGCISEKRIQEES